jgi:hypothetical protein
MYEAACWKKVVESSCNDEARHAGPLNNGEIDQSCLCEGSIQLISKPGINALGPEYCHTFVLKIMEFVDCCKTKFRLSDRTPLGWYDRWYSAM